MSDLYVIYFKLFGMQFGNVNATYFSLDAECLLPQPYPCLIGNVLLAECPGLEFIGSSCLRGRA